MKDLISVIVPVYNTKPYLKKCITSILNQSYRNIELILVDDGSKDGSGVICDEMAQQDHRIRVFHQRNAGSSAARNFAITQARGQYIGFVDSDDTIESDMYEALYAAVCKHGVEVAQIGRDEIDEAGNKLPDICLTPSEEEVIGREDFMKELLFHRGDCSFCTKLVKKELFAGLHFPVGVLNEDFHLLVKMLLHTQQVVSLPQIGYHVLYRMGSNTRKATGFSRVFLDNVNNADMVFDLVKVKYANLEEVAVRFGFVQRLDYLLHIPLEDMKNGNTDYRKIVQYVRTYGVDFMKNPYLTRKQKVYLILLGFMPKLTRRIHSFTMRLRGHR